MFIYYSQRAVNTIELELTLKSLSTQFGLILLVFFLFCYNGFQCFLKRFKSFPTSTIFFPSDTDMDSFIDSSLLLISVRFNLICNILAKKKFFIHILAKLSHLLFKHAIVHKVYPVPLFTLSSRKVNASPNLGC